MAAKKPPLRKLVALKRQRAEQELLSVQQDLNALTAELRHLEQELSGLDGERGGIETHILSYEHGFLQRQVQSIAACRTRILEKEAEYFTAREALKKAFDSEDRLRRAEKRP